MKFRVAKHVETEKGNHVLKVKLVSDGPLPKNSMFGINMMFGKAMQVGDVFEAEGELKTEKAEILNEETGVKEEKTVCWFEPA